MTAGEHNQKGIDYLTIGNSEEAIEEFKICLELGSLRDESRLQVLRNIAIAYHDLDIIDTSRYYSQQAADLAKKNKLEYEYLLNSADVHIIDGDIELAINKLEQAKDKRPTEFEVYNSLGLIYLGEYDEMYADFDKALEHNKICHQLNPSRFTKDVLAKSYYMLDILDTAQVYYKELELDYPQVSDYNYYLGMIAYESGDTTKAMSILSELVAVDSAYYYYVDYIVSPELYE